ncbi:sulfatase-like hydrolase/transferase [Paenibacillus hexagrammi]|uniref:Sulfatase-like hydrolase/transferase n=1 Tax=Paenibacillus hexagrammi TaxID=2908839 RepID=A0ABY3SGQ0_9BACL|nr:sulfatase-like hydrolase/transferase [Paenibacillus sp. YPD9-1]UJF33213.1 sulfatase-like hydrolase/transferase [Paenibacillus sp. YPD9-1]
MDYNHELEKLIAKHSMRKASFLNRWSQLDSHDVVAIWGAGEHTRILLDMVSLCDKNVICIVDNDPQRIGTEIEGLPVYHPSQINELGIDTVVISSFVYAEAIMQEIQMRFPQLHCLQVYTEYEPNPITDPWKLYYDLQHLNKEYRTANDESIKERFLWELICAYVEIRDFELAQEHIALYAQYKFPKADLLLRFKDELNVLLDQLKSDLQNRKQKDISLFVIDSLRADDLYDSQELRMPRTHGLLEHSLIYTNVHTTSTYTKAAVNAMLTERLMIDDELYLERKIDANHSNLLKFLSQERYLLINFSGAFEFVEVEAARVHNVYRSTRKTKIKKQWPTATIIWNYFCTLANNKDQPIFALIHSLDVHFPLVCPYHSKFQDLRDASRKFYTEQFYFRDHKEQILFQRNECLSYIDRKLHDFQQFISSPHITIICSDHGESLGENQSFGHLFSKNTSVTHIPLVVHGISRQPQEIGKLFSMKFFGAEIVSLLTGQPAVPAQNEVMIQRDPIYSTEIHVDGFTAFVDPRILQGFKIVRGQADSYVLYDDGSEEYYSIKDESANLAADTCYSERIDHLRAIAIKAGFPYKGE